MRCCVSVFFFFKQKTAYEMRISDWSSDVCSSDLLPFEAVIGLVEGAREQAGSPALELRGVGARRTGGANEPARQRHVAVVVGADLGDDVGVVVERQGHERAPDRGWTGGPARTRRRRS